VLFPEPGIPIKTILVGFLSMAAHIGILRSWGSEPYSAHPMRLIPLSISFR